MIPFLLFTSNDHGNEYDERHKQQQKTHSIPIGGIIFSRLHQRSLPRPLSLPSFLFGFSIGMSGSIGFLFCTLSSFRCGFTFLLLAFMGGGEGLAFSRAL
jgi:hypothetical protein